MKKQPKTEEPKGGIYQFNVTGHVPTEWKIDLNTVPGTVVMGSSISPDVVFIIEDEHLMKIKTGKLNIQTAFIQGRLKIEGDFAQALRLGKILGKMIQTEG